MPSSCAGDVQKSQQTSGPTIWIPSGRRSSAAQVGEAMQFTQPDRAIAGLDVAEYPTGTDRGELLIITDQPDTAAERTYSSPLHARCAAPALLYFAAVRGAFSRRFATWSLRVERSGEVRPHHLLDVIEVAMSRNLADI
jgi:hypothetical protein